MRYADDFVILARGPDQRLRSAVEDRLERAMKLRINREKTRTVNLQAPGVHLDFLGYTFRYVKDRHGRNTRYLEMAPSRKSLARERAVLRDKTGPRRGWLPLKPMIEELNAHLRGWANYFGHGYPRAAFREINSYVRYRLARHLRRRSQRRYRSHKGTSLYRHLAKEGLIYL